MKHEPEASRERSDEIGREKRLRLRSREDERKEGMVLLVIAILFLANVVLYLCHHYRFTSLNDLGAKAAISARVVVD